MYYFLKEQLYLSKQEIENIKESKNFNILLEKTISLDMETLNHEEVTVYKNFLYYAIESQDLMFLKNIISQGYYFKVFTIDEENKVIFQNSVKGFVSYVGKYYNEEILKYLLIETKKISLKSIIKNVLINKKIKNKLESIYYLYKHNNQSIKLQETEILQNLIESENLEGIKSLQFILGNIDIKEIFYYLTAIKNEMIIDYLFGLNIQGDKLYNEMALTLLVENTSRFKKFYEKMPSFLIGGELISQILETENTELLDYLNQKNALIFNYSSNIIGNIIFHCIAKNKLKSLKALLSLLDYDLSVYFKIKNQYAIQINKEMEDFVLKLIEKQELKNKLEIKLKSIKKNKVDKI